MLLAEKVEGNIIHLIRTESGDIFEFNKNNIPFKDLKECGISKKQIIEALKKYIIKENRMEIYLTEEQKQIKVWREQEKFTEMSRIGNLPKHKDISVWVNEKGEEREEPHFHIRLSNNEVIRIKFKDLTSMDKKELDPVIRKEFIKWLTSTNKFDKDITNIKASLLIWNSQEYNTRIVKMKDLKWANKI